MIARVLIVMLVLAGAHPLRICTCAAEDEPLLSTVGNCDEGHHDGCHCPILKPVAKLVPVPVSIPTDASFDSLLPIREWVRADVGGADSPRKKVGEHPPGTPRYLALRTLLI